MRVLTVVIFMRHLISDNVNIIMNFSTKFDVNKLENVMIRINALGAC